MIEKIVAAIVAAITSETFRATIAPLIGAFIVGGAGGTFFERLGVKRTFGNRDLKILEENIRIVFRQSGNPDNIEIRIRREFKLKLISNTKGVYAFRLDLRGGSISGSWKQCEVRVNGSQMPVPVTYEEDDAVVTSAARRLRPGDTIDVVLDSEEVVAKRRRFYALIISNPKNETFMLWDSDGLSLQGLTIYPYVSSEDFELIVPRPRVDEKIYTSLHPVSYFFMWAEGAVG
jgi:uncharacterized protein YacL (UPF0231 family)